MTFRRAVFWLHLSVGVTVGLVVLVLAATGVLLTYERQIVAWTERGAVASDPARPTLDADGAVAAALANGARPGNAVVLGRDPAVPLRVTAGRRTQALIDPRSGAVLDGAGASTKAFFGTVTTVHRWLAMSGDARTTGGAITAAANLGFMALLVSGVAVGVPAHPRARRPRAGDVQGPRLQLAPRVRRVGAAAARRHRGVGRDDLVPVGARPDAPCGGRDRVDAVG
jgi:uncharacterized iron-regulated membrane protein